MSRVKEMTAPDALEALYRQCAENYEEVGRRLGVSGGTVRAALTKGEARMVLELAAMQCLDPGEVVDHIAVARVPTGSWELFTALAGKLGIKITEI